MQKSMRLKYEHFSELLHMWGSAEQVAFCHLDVLYRHALDQPVLTQMNLIQ
jgi:hypothetical protein